MNNSSSCAQLQQDHSITSLSCHVRLLLKLFQTTLLLGEYKDRMLLWEVVVCLRLLSTAPPNGRHREEEYFLS